MPNVEMLVGIASCHRDSGPGVIVPSGPEFNLRQCNWAETIRKIAILRVGGGSILGMRITAVTMAIPPRVQNAHELAPLIHRSADWIAQQTGVFRRHVADDDVSPAQLAACAARAALSSTGPPDLILYAGALTQQLVPDTSAFVQRELELERIPCFTIGPVQAPAFTFFR